MKKVFRQETFVLVLVIACTFVILSASAGMALLLLSSRVDYGEIFAMFVIAAIWMLIIKLFVYIRSDITIDAESIGLAVFSWTVVRVPWQSITHINVFRMPSRRDNARPIVFAVAFSENGRKRKIVFGNRISNYAELRDELARRVHEFSIPVEGDGRGELLSVSVTPTPAGLP